MPVTKYWPPHVRQVANGALKRAFRSARNFSFTLGLGATLTPLNRVKRRFDFSRV